MSQLFTTGDQSIGASASASVLPMNIQGWFLIELTVWYPCCPRDSQESSPTPQFKSINSLVHILLYGLSHPYMTTGTIALTIWAFVHRGMSLLSRFVIAFLPRNKGLLISWLQSPSTVILEPKKIKFVTVSIVMKWWDGMARCSLFVCWVLSPLFHSPLSPSSRGSLLLFAFFH